MPKVHDPKNEDCKISIEMERFKKGSPIFINEADCTCSPTIQHEEKNKECHCNAYEGHPQCSFCTCSRQGEPKVDMSCPCGCGIFMTEKHYSCFHGQECGEADCPHQDNHKCKAFEGSSTEKPRCLECGKTTQEKQDWEARAFILASNCWDMDWMPDKSARKLFIDFIRKEKELSKEEGRMAQAQASYQAGVNYAMEFHVNGECEKRIKEARLEVIVETEDKMLREIVPSKYEHLPEHARAGAVLQDCLAIVCSLKTNSK